MAQTSPLTIPDSDGTAFLADVNAKNAALFSSNSGAAAPSTTVAGMLWFDTGVSPPVLRQRNAANTAWNRIIDTADLSASQTALGATATGAALFTAANAAAGRTSLGVLSTLSNPLNLDVGGFIIKSGDGVTSGIGIQNVVFNTAFPNALIGVSVTPITTAATCGSADSPTSTGFQARTFFSTSGSFTPSGYRWIAIGY